MQKFINIFMGKIKNLKNWKDKENNNYEDGIFIGKTNDEYPLKVFFKL